MSFLSNKLSRCGRRLDVLFFFFQCSHRHSCRPVYLSQYYSGTWPYFDNQVVDQSERATVSERSRPAHGETKTNVSGLRSQVSGVFLLLMTCGFVGCDVSWSTLPANSSSRSPKNHLQYDGGFIFADREHTVGIDIATWGLRSINDVTLIQSSCECVQAKLIELGDASRMKLLVVDVFSDRRMSRNASLAVGIDALFADGSKKSLSFVFTHVAAPHDTIRQGRQE